MQLKLKFQNFKIDLKGNFICWPSSLFKTVKLGTHSAQSYQWYSYCTYTTNVISTLNSKIGMNIHTSNQAHGPCTRVDNQTFDIKDFPIFHICFTKSARGTRGLSDYIIYIFSSINFFFHEENAWFEDQPLIWKSCLIHPGE